ncbi:MAG: hypothetical protein IJ305_05450 [Oscillospiraceae bacterium]|nr:hypothetical protein [Oscillospiraceae bacterium]
MRMKKIVSAVLASVVAAGICAANAFAVEDGKATYCFDNTACVEDFVSYGSVEATNMKLTHTMLESKNGNGCLIISESLTEEPADKFGGFYIEASTLGLESFQGCTVEMSVKLCEGAENCYDNFSLFSDGIIWLSQSAASLSTTEWTTLSLVLPEGANNNKVGFTIPTFNICNSDIVYIDDFVVTDANGNTVINQGDYVIKSVTIEDAASTGQNIGMTILLVILILAIVGGIGLIVSNALRRFS